MKKVRISGGLGNQLFQYGFGLYLKEVLGKDVVYVLEKNSSTKKWVNRDLHLKKLFNIDCSLGKQPAWLYRIKRKLSMYAPGLFKMYIENIYHQPIKKDVIERYDYFEGYWQCIDYVDPVREIIIRNLKTSIDRIKQTQTGLQILSENCYTVSLHVRHGDYMTIASNAQLFGVLPIDYYKRALRAVAEREGKVSVYVFSDDIEWCKSKFNGECYHFIQGNSPIEDMILMSLCKCNILANSTFSWWSAYLNQNKDKRVYVTRNWYVNKENNQLRCFIPENYIQI